MHGHAWAGRISRDQGGPPRDQGGPPRELEGLLEGAGRASQGSLRVSEVNKK